MAASAPVQASSGNGHGPRWRQVGAWVLLVVFCLGMVASLAALWARAQVLDTDAYVETVTPLAADPAIQEAVADRVTALLGELIQRDDATRSALADVAGGVATAIVLDVVHRTVLDFVQSDTFQGYWVSANEIAHQRAIDALTSDADGVVFLANGQLVLDLNPVIGQVEDRLRAAGLDVVDRIQVDPARATFVLFESDAVRKAQEGIEVLDTLAIVLPIVTLVTLVGCLLLAPRRWHMLIRAGIGTAVAMVVALVLLSMARDRYLDALGSGGNVDALASVFDIVLRELRDAVRVTAIAGLVVAGFAALASSAVIRQPRVVTVVARYRTGLTGGILALACVVLVVADRISLGLALGVGILALLAVLAVAWLARLPVSQAGTTPAPEPAA